MEAITIFITMTLVSQVSQPKNEIVINLSFYLINDSIYSNSWFPLLRQRKIFSDFSRITISLAPH
jgi:hypothetical protein